MVDAGSAVVAHEEDVQGGACDDAGGREYAVDGCEGAKATGQ